MTDRTYTSRRDTNAVVQDWDGLIIGPEHSDEWSAYQSWVESGNTPTPPEPEPIGPLTPISDRQFFQQAALVGIITPAEALAAVKTGDIPPILQTIVDAIPSEQQKFGATMLLSGATTFERHHPLTEAVGQALGWTSAQIDQFFADAALL